MNNVKIEYLMKEDRRMMVDERDGDSKMNSCEK